MSAASADPPRYTRRPFPRYRYVPGKMPHPTRDPDGHSYGREPPAIRNFDPERWQDCEEYLYGIDLFNHGYWWEAHEALEAVWVAAGRHTTTGLFLQGLIQVSAGLLKHYQGLKTGAEMLCTDGLVKLRLRTGVFLGIDVNRLASETRDFLAGHGAGPPIIELAGCQPCAR
jgi:hypothetical protein